MLMAEFPQALQAEFERVARLRYGENSLNRALIEAVELWLAQQRDLLIEAEAKANDRAYEALKDELEREHWGQWIVIAHGQLQGIGDSPEELLAAAPEARDRIVMQIGEVRPKEVELGWEASFQYPLRVALNRQANGQRMGSGLADERLSL